MHYTLNQLRIYLKVVELQSVTKASQELFMTQPAVSIQLKKFQDQFEIPLVEVIGKRLYITEFGNEVALSASSILEEAERIRTLTLSYKGLQTGTLKVCSASTGKYVMPYFLDEFLKNHPGIELRLDVTNKSSVVKSLEQNQTDFALVSILPEHLDVEFETLLPNKLFLVASYHTHFPKRLSAKHLSELNWIFREEGSATRVSMEQFLSRLDVKVGRKMELVSNEAVKQAVVAGLGCSIMPLIGIKHELNNQDLKIIPFSTLPIETSWYLIWLKGKNLSPAARFYLKYLKEHKDEMIEKKFGWYVAY